jgi:Ca2+-binding EF-hand superfamily protein
LSNDKLFEYLDVNKDNIIVKKEFFSNTMDAGFSDFSRDEMDEVFKYIDQNRNGVISLKEFK